MTDLKRIIYEMPVSPILSWININLMNQLQFCLPQQTITEGTGQRFCGTHLTFSSEANLFISEQVNVLGYENTFISQLEKSFNW